MYEAVAALLTFNAEHLFRHRQCAAAARTTNIPPSCPTRPSSLRRLDQLGVANDDLWRRFCKAADGGSRGRPAIRRRRRRPRAQPRPLVPLVRQAISKQRTRDDWLARFDKAGVPSGAIRTVAEVCESDVLKARGMVAEMATCERRQCESHRQRRAL